MKKILLSVCLSFVLVITMASCSNSDEVKESQAITETSCGEKILDPAKKYDAVFETTKGTIVVTLDVKNAPISTAHLASLIKSGFYNGLTFHRVVTDFVIQGGDPKGDGTGSSKCKVISEEPPKSYVQGDFAWAKASTEPAGTAGSQFFIVTGKNDSRSVEFLNQKTPDIDGKLKIQYGYAGKVTKGLDVALAIEALSNGTSDSKPTETVKIIKASLKS
ncbi:MAG: peptidylprolyl isomerase [Acidimicrobiia bacterium]